MESKFPILDSSETKAIKLILDFVEGRIDTKSFYELLHKLDELKTLLDDHTRDWNDLYQYVKHSQYDLSSNFSPFDLLLYYEGYPSGPGTSLNIQDMLEKFLDLHRIRCTPTKIYHDLFKLLLDSQPRWLDVDQPFLMKLLAETPDSPKSVRKQILRQKLLSLFRFNSKPPRWIQAAEWPIIDDRPLVFVGQLHVSKSEYFHDDGVAYVFFDPKTSSTQTIIQLY